MIYLLALIVGVLIVAPTVTIVWVVVDLVRKDRASRQAIYDVFEEMRRSGEFLELLRNS